MSETLQPMTTAPRDGTWVKLVSPKWLPDGCEVQWATQPDLRFPGATVNGEAGFWRTRDGWMACFEDPCWKPLKQ